MRKTSLRLTLDEFDDPVDFYDALVDKIAAAERVIRYKYEKTELLDAFVLRLVGFWEWFVEALMVGCLNRDTSRYAEYRGLTLRKHLSADEVYAMLTGLGYLNFRSVGDLRGRARQILVVNPFKAIPETAARRIDELITMRNYLAHYSRQSKRALAALYEDTYGMVRFRDPGDFLWASVRPGGTSIRFTL